MLKAQSISAGEYYIAPLYNGMIHDKLRIAAQSVDRFYVFGIPSEYEFYRNHILRNSSIQRVGICSDHSGFKLKEELHAILEFFKIKVIDYGTHSTANTDYNEWVSKAADGYLNNEVDLIIASCLSGQGVAVAASTYPFLIPSIIYDSEAAQLAMLHTCSNFLAFPSKVWNTNFDLKSALHVVLNTKFEGGRHQLRLMKMLENKL
jgi:ribose 5-phosphate isomerase B